MKIIELMDNAAMEMRKILWDGFVDHKISLNWIDLRPQQMENLSDEDKVSEYVCNFMSNCTSTEFFLGYPTFHWHLISINCQDFRWLLDSVLITSPRYMRRIWFFYSKHTWPLHINNNRHIKPICPQQEGCWEHNEA
jgi:hypothetical protein